MNNTKKFLSVLGFAVAALSMNAVAQDKMDAAATPEKEKCYGVVKAGANDCASADGSHSCAGNAKADAAKTEWVSLPKGTCERIVGGSLTPPQS